MPVLAYRTKLYLSPSASKYLFGAAGARRFAWNWSLAESKRAWEEEKKTLTEYDLVKRFNAIKKSEFPWILQYSKWVPQLAASALWKTQKRAFKAKKGFPKFKKKGVCPPSFQVAFPAMRIDKDNPKLLQLANCPHSLRISKPLRFQGKILRATFVREADGWYVSFQIDVEGPWSYPHACESQASCGIDLGLKTSMTVADEEGVSKLNAPDLGKLEARLRRAQQSLSRKQKGSQNRWKAKNKLAKVHQKIARIRSGFLHQTTAELVKRYRNLGVETLNVSGMLKNHSLARAIAREGWGEFRRQLEYKARLSGSNVVLADRFFPSSKLCSGCGWKNEGLALGDRVWVCPQCGLDHDRDANAAHNLRKLAEGYSESRNDCGEEVSPCARTAKRSGRKASLDEAVIGGAC